MGVRDWRTHSAGRRGPHVEGDMLTTDDGILLVTWLAFGSGAALVLLHDWDRSKAEAHDIGLPRLVICGVLIAGGFLTAAIAFLWLLARERTHRQRGDKTSANRADKFL